MLISSTPLLTPHGVTTLSGLSKVFHKLGHSLCTLVLQHSRPSLLQEAFCAGLRPSSRWRARSLLATPSCEEAFAPSRAATNLAIDPATSPLWSGVPKLSWRPCAPRSKTRTYDGQEDEAWWLADRHGNAVSPASLCRLLSTIIVRDGDDDGAYMVCAAEMCLLFADLYGEACYSNHLVCWAHVPRRMAGGAW
jgi:hypothetical protein